MDLVYQLTSTSTVSSRLRGKLILTVASKVRPGEGTRHHTHTTWRDVLGPSSFPQAGTPTTIPQRIATRWWLALKNHIPSHGVDPLDNAPRIRKRANTERP